jgi:hypothetical protein
VNLALAEITVPEVNDLPYSIIGVELTPVAGKWSTPAKVPFTIKESRGSVAESFFSALFH